MKIAVIGAGAAGLCAGRHALAANYEVILFEQTDSVGGTWVYTAKVDKDEYGMPVHSSMYKGLRINIPKEIMGYPDYPIPDDPSSFVPGTTIHAYLESFADDFHVREHIRFLHEVVRVRPISGSSKWEVRAADVLSIVRQIVHNRYESMEFDAVIVCNGHYKEPIMPAFDGLEHYQGNHVHSKYVKDLDQFKDKSILIVGLGPTGEDFAKTTSTVASRVVVSHRNPNVTRKLPSQIVRKPNIRRFTEEEVEFLDGSIETFDHIIFCTGYKYSFPFLSVDSGITVEEGRYVKPLFKQCINIEHPTMLLAGLVFRTCPFQVIDVQVRCFLSLLRGNRQLPTRSEMLAITAHDMEKVLKRDGSKRFMHALGNQQAEYYNDLSTIGGVDNIKPYVLKIYENSIAYWLTGGDFRRQTFRIIDDHNFTTSLLG